MTRLSAKFHIALGQTFLLVSLILLAFYLGLVPDRLGAIREGRAALAEAIAGNSSAFITQRDIRRLEANLRLVVTRNPDILSAGVRKANGKPVVTIGDHERRWRTLAGEYSTDTQLRVPIWSGDKKWGYVELRYQPLVASGWWGTLRNPRTQLLVFMALVGFVVFYIYLGKMLRQLDPQLAIDVKDSGIGMPGEKLDAIFDPFAQADSSITRRFGGTGLGLAISRRFAQALGGNITVRSKVGEGSVFTVTLDTGSLDDVRMLEPGRALIVGKKTTSNGRSRCKFLSGSVLVVDDGEENRELLTLVLEETGLVVEVAENGEVGVEKVQQGSFDVILMDMQMPVLDGFTATQQLREQGVQTPIIALTAHAMKGFEEKIMAAGCSGYLTKPIDFDALIQTLAELLGEQPMENEEKTGLAGGSGPDDQSTSEPEHAGPPLVSRLPTNSPRLRAIIEKFVRGLDEKLEIMEKAWHEKNFDELARLAHWLKGTGGSVGFDVFTDPAGSLEEFAKARREDQIAALLAELRQLASRVVVSSDDDTAHGSPVRNAS